MTLRVLDVVPRDVAAEALGLLLDAPVPPALAELRLRDADGGSLTLHVLGASHAVLAERPGRRLTEQVSCEAIAAGGQPLPRRDRRGGYTITSVTAAASGSELAATAARLTRLAERDDDRLCGTFPGDGAALTALHGAALPAGGWTWETWHLYPGRGGGTVVRTRSRWQP